MSLPLTRRIARAALLIAAGAAPVVGAAGAAGAAELPQAPELGGLTTVDGAGLGKTVDGASQQGTKAAGETGGKIVGTTLPAASKTVGKAAPTVQNAAGGAAGSAGEVLGGAAGAAPHGGLPVQGLPIG
ncbi:MULTISPECIES: ATP-binding protein [Streptomyces]|uniref:ATP-binding protein n=1 Tax=Streptomyces atratus TaxID=1893 RepID=A0A2Z5JHZ8_STRAR|nr:MULTISPECIES: ATP-binding protein [Streptomyces]AXE80006.1 ATP-binding protein [Streptomyces atratus]MEE1813130.1 ATP-binding protein [Streptomyces sp. BE133]